MIRTILIPDKQEVCLRVPISYVGRKVEVIAFALDEVNVEFKKLTMADFWGVISDETANELHRESAKSRDDWEDRLKKQF